MFRRTFFGWRSRKAQWTSRLVSSWPRQVKSWMMSFSQMSLVGIIKHFFPFLLAGFSQNSKYFFQEAKGLMSSCSSLATEFSWKTGPNSEVVKSDHRATKYRESEILFSRWSWRERKYDWARECTHNPWGARDYVPCLHTFAVLPGW